jgi:hypothetical protein
MGLETAGYALAAISTGAKLGQMSAEKKAAAADLSALNQQSKLLSLQYSQKHLQNLDLIDKMLSRQAAQLATRGVAFDSPSFNAIQRETINAGVRKESVLNTEQSLAEQNIAIERKNVKDTLHARLFGDTASLSFGLADFYDKIPKKLPQVEDL